MSVSLINGHIDDDVQMTDNEMIERLNKGEGFDYDDIIDLINRLKAEIERLEIKIEGVQEANAILREHIRKAVKEFAARLKEKATDVGVCDAQGNNYGCATVVFIDDIDNLVKEKVGEG